MKLHKTDPTDLKPCKHMEGLVSARSDGKLSGIALWYTNWHVSQCGKCQAGIKTLDAMKRRLGDLDGAGEPTEAQTLSAAHWAKLEDEWASVEGAGHSAEPS